MLTHLQGSCVEIGEIVSQNVNNIVCILNGCGYSTTVVAFYLLTSVHQAADSAIIGPTPLLDFFNEISTFTIEIICVLHCASVYVCLSMIQNYRENVEHQCERPMFMRSNSFPACSFLSYLSQKDSPGI